nr:MAG TPA: hypothetical protein [Caudoviricetes sp.]
MKMFLLGFLVCYVIASLFYFLDDEADTNLMVSFIKPWVAVLLVILFIPYSIWRFVSLCFKSVRPDAMDCLKDAYVKRLFGNIYFCHDKKS